MHKPLRKFFGLIALVFGVCIGISSYSTVLAQTPPSSQVVAPAWVQRYSVGQRGELADTIRVDSDGNIYVGGFSNGSWVSSPNDLRSLFDIVKYAPNGTVIWSRTYEAPNPQQARVAEFNDMVVAPDKGVVIVGKLQDKILGTACIVMKYDLAGTLLWTQTYSGLPIAADTVDEQEKCQAVDTDAAGNIYVTGTVLERLNGNGPVVVNGLVAKYSAAGVLAWNYSYPGPSAAPDILTHIEVGSGGDIYVAGKSGARNSAGDLHENYALIKLRANGTAAWTKQYDGSNGENDEFIDMALDANNAVYLSGTTTSVANSLDIVTLKYATDGTLLWEKAYNGVSATYGSTLDRPYALVVGADALYITGVSGIDLEDNYRSIVRTLKYNLNGGLEWAKSYTNQYNYGSDGGVDIALLPAGGVAVLATIEGLFADDYFGAPNYATIGYDSNGTQRWEAIYDGPRQAEDVPAAIAVDAAGSVYVTGMSWGGGAPTETIEDWATIKYNPPTQAPSAKIRSGVTTEDILISKP